MSDNIDYDELDKAVTEAIKAKNTKTPRSAMPKKVTLKTPLAKTAARPVATATTINRPVRRQYMDFVARPTTSHNIAQTAKTTAPAKTPTVKTATATTKHAISTTPTVAQNPFRSRPVTAASRPTVTPTAKVVTKAPNNAHLAAQIQRKQTSAAQPRPTTITKTTVPSPTQEQASQQKDAVPNANNYSLGGRSPFLENATVEKRPLGTNVPETNASNLQSTKNIYSQKSPSKHASKQIKHTVVESPKKHSGLLWTLLVIFIIAAGGGLGYLAYLLVFPN